MSEKAASAYVNEFEGHLVGSVQVELTESVLDNFREHLLEAVQRTRPMGVIIDVSAVPFMDVQEFAQLRRILNMTALMGGRPILVGLQLECGCARGQEPDPLRRVLPQRRGPTSAAP